MLTPRRPRRGLDDEAQVTEVLRMLWHLHFASTAQLSRLVLGSAKTQELERLRPALRRLHASDLVWREAWRLLPGYLSHRAGPCSGGFFYGLTERGRQAAHARLPELEAVHCLTREGYMSAAERRTMVHSAHYTEWCTGLIEDLRHHPQLAGLFLETESTRLGTHLRMDGLIRLRLLRTPPARVPIERPLPWTVPWMELRAARDGDAVDVTFALEIDEGTEQLETIVHKAMNYRRTYLGGMQPPAPAAPRRIAEVPWATVLCPAERLTLDQRRMDFPIPVFVVPGGGRLATVHTAWQRGWKASEVRVTSWRHIRDATSIVRAPYLNQHGAWVDLIGHPHPAAELLPPPPGVTEAGRR